MKKLLAFGILVILFFPACAKKSADTSQAPPATPLEQGLLSLKDNLGKKDYAQAWLSLRSSLEAFWGEAPLLLDNVKFVTSENNTFGIYTPKNSDEFAPGEVIRLYCEPVGYTVNKNDQGQYEFAFKADFSLADEKGKVLGEQKDFANLNFTSWNFNTEVALTFTYTFTGLEKGKYRIITLVKDAQSEKTATVEKMISII